VIIFDTYGNAKININEDNNITHSNDPIIKEALESDTYIEKYMHTDIFKTQNETLIFANKIEYNNKMIGVLCLCFKFEDELKKIFQALSNNKEIIQICNSTKVIATNNNKFEFIKQVCNEKQYDIVQNKYIAVSEKASGYQGYNGIDDWYVNTIIDSRHHSINIKHKENKQEEDCEPSVNENILSDELIEIIDKANNIIEDISDVIINGELIASKQKVYVLTPILDNLRNISTELLASIKESVKNLEEVIEDGIMNDVKMASHLAIDIMDRNLYERANDCRWWALTPIFNEELAKNEPDTDILSKELLDINTLYTVYTNIFIYDKNAKIIASAKDDSIIGKKLQDEYIIKTLSNRNTQRYFVSDFENTQLYNNKPTYIYSASILHNNSNVGGIGLVFNAEDEFKAMIKDSFISTADGFMVFVDKNKTIISSSNKELLPLQQIDIDDKYISTKSIHALCEYVTYNGTRYILASVYSKGYREYKNQDNYKNDIFCLTFVKA
jgi:hypothetical protein